MKKKLTPEMKKFVRERRSFIARIVIAIVAVGSLIAVVVSVWVWAAAGMPQ